MVVRVASYPTLSRWCAGWCEVRWWTQDQDPDVRLKNVKDPWALADFSRNSEHKESLGVSTTVARVLMMLAPQDFNSEHAMEHASCIQQKNMHNKMSF